jgi:ABC-2 type transport system permease protein
MTPYPNSPPGATPSDRSRALMRLRGLIRKEFLQALRDPSSLGIAFVLPVVLLLLFGYGVSLDAEHVPLALVVEKPPRIPPAFAARLNSPAILIRAT